MHSFYQVYYIYIYIWWGEVRFWNGNGWLLFFPAVWLEGVSFSFRISRKWKNFNPSKSNMDSYLAFKVYFNFDYKSNILENMIILIFIQIHFNFNRKSNIFKK